MSGPRINGPAFPDRPTMTQLPLIAPTSIGPAPLPIELAAVEGRNSQTGEKVILIQVVTPAGVLIGFITEQMAKAYGELLTTLGTGIVLAPASALHH